MNKDIAISVKGVSKTFKIPHEKVSSIRGAVTGIFRDKSYEEFKALDNVSFEVKKGEFFGIIGRNGSGKSTLLKVLAGIYQADKGRVKVNGMISPFLELGIGFNPELSGRDNVYLNATVLGMTQKQIDEKFDAIVAFSELERFIDQKLKNYSSGMQVRLAFSVSIHANRDILLMDEVLAVGDSNFQSKCLTEFAKYKDMNRTVVIVTHDITVVQRYCDRAMLIRNGKIVKIGKAEEVGNTYVYENMSDEEKRIRDEEKRQQKDREKKLSINSEDFIAGGSDSFKEKTMAEITGVEFLDKNGTVKNIFKTGDDLMVRVYFNALNKELVTMVHFGLALFNQDGDYIVGINTEIDNVNTSVYLKKGFFQVCFPKIPLQKNAYYVKASISDKVSGKAYDFLDKSKDFQIFQLNKNQGIIAMQYKWME